MTRKDKVLVVDDEPRNVKLLSSYLRHDDFLVSSAFNGPAALAAVESELPDVILLDIMMPGMDGLEVTRRLKANPDTQHIPVVLITAMEGAENRVKGLDAGADEFLTKPVNKTELQVRVRALVRMKQMQDELRNRIQVTTQILESDTFQNRIQGCIVWLYPRCYLKRPDNS